jgi:uncharacterized hydantoinase/oxoprolinase family protein
MTMSGEMVDAVRASRRGRAAHRGSAARRPPALGQVRFFAGDLGWIRSRAGRHAVLEQIASANWLATARHAARAMPQARGCWSTSAAPPPT